MYKAGIIGLGFIGVKAPDSHLRAYQEDPRIKLVFQEDIDWEEKMGQILASHEINIVSVCTPVETHCDIVCKISHYVNAIWCEKPISSTLEEADMMIAVCHKYGTILQVNHQRRFIRPKFKFKPGISTTTHVFDLLRQLFGEIEIINKRTAKLPNGLYIDLVESEGFEFDCTHNEERMLPAALNHLIECLEEKQESISNGIEAREDLRLSLEYEKAENPTMTLKVGRQWLNIPC